MKYTLGEGRSLNLAALGIEINEMPAYSVCVCCLIGKNVKTATSIFHTRMTKAAYLWKQRRSGSGFQILLSPAHRITSHHMDHVSVSSKAQR